MFTLTCRALASRIFFVALVKRETRGDILRFESGSVVLQRSKNKMKNEPRLGV